MIGEPGVQESLLEGLQAYLRGADLRDSADKADALVAQVAEMEDCLPVATFKVDSHVSGAR